MELVAAYTVRAWNASLNNGKTHDISRHERFCLGRLADLRDMVLVLDNKVFASKEFISMMQLDHYIDEWRAEHICIGRRKLWMLTDDVILRAYEDLGKYRGTTDVTKRTRELLEWLMELA